MPLVRRLLILTIEGPHTYISAGFTQNGALFNLQSLLSALVLLICACAYIHTHWPSLLDKHKTGCVPNDNVLSFACRAPPFIVFFIFVQIYQCILEVCPYRRAIESGCFIDMFCYGICNFMEIAVAFRT